MGYNLNLSVIALQVAWAVVWIGRANDRQSFTEHAILEEQKADYNITPIQLGAEVRGINLKGYVPPHVIEQIKADVTKYGLLVFKNQGVVPASRHVDITKWFGPLKVTFKLHNAQEHPEVFRVSNEDWIGNGKSISLGWHNDGALPKTTISHSLFHILSVSRTSDTWFTSLYDLVDRMDPRRCARFERLYFEARSKEGHFIKPVVYSHPKTHKRVMLLYSGAVQKYVYDHGSPLSRPVNQKIARAISREITHLIEMNNGTYIYKHKWELGDFIIVDNQAVAHKAPRESSEPAEKVGLRVLHRSSADSMTKAAKNYDPTSVCPPIVEEEETPKPDQNRNPGTNKS